MKRIHESLKIVLERHRLVFWYDPDGQWLKAFDSFEAPFVNKLKVEGNDVFRVRPRK